MLPGRGGHLAMISHSGADDIVDDIVSSSAQYRVTQCEEQHEAAGVSVDVSTHNNIHWPLSQQHKFISLHIF